MSYNIFVFLLTHTRGTGPPRGHGSRDYFENLDNLSQQVESRRSQRLQQRSVRGQSSINDWLQSQPLQPQQQSQIHEPRDNTSELGDNKPTPMYSVMQGVITTVKFWTGSKICGTYFWRYEGTLNA